MGEQAPMSQREYDYMAEMAAEESWGDSPGLITIAKWEIDRLRAELASERYKRERAEAEAKQRTTHAIYWKQHYEWAAAACIEKDKAIRHLMLHLPVPVDDLTESASVEIAYELGRRALSMHRRTDLAYAERCERYRGCLTIIRDSLGGKAGELAREALQEPRDD